MSTFAETGLSPELLRGVEELGFKEPTPIQAKVIPLLIKGRRDIVALAQTGTGKTAAFGLPLLQLTDPENHTIQAIVLCPTRELCLQISKDLANFGHFAPQLRVLAVYGGSSIQTQIRALHRGVHILVATPGRLLDLLRRGAARLDSVQRVVLDEADEMLNMGFQEDLEAILGEVPEQVRTLLFSATMPKQVAAIAANYMDDPEEVIVASKQAGAANIEHICHVVQARDRYETLKRVLDCNPSFYGIVFCRTRAETHDICAGLQTDGYMADSLHGDLSQEQRDRVMRQFRNRSIRILVATDVAARGLDVHDLTHVIHYDLPGDPDVYTHRSGRTGRAGKSGVSILLAHMREERKIRQIERCINKPIESRPVPSGDEVCAARLSQLLNELRSPPASPAVLDPFRKAIQERLQDLSREEILDLFMLREFGQTVLRYQDARDLNQPPPPPAKRARRDEKPTSKRKRAEYSDDESFFAIRVNIGKRNGLTPATLISLINRATPGPMLPLGRIRVLDTDSILEIPGNAADLIIGNLNRMTFQKRQIRAVPASH